MKLLSGLVVLSLLCGAAVAGPPKRADLTDTRRVLGPKDTVVVDFSEVRKYRCAEGALIAREWGARMRLRCDVSDTIAIR